MASLKAPERSINLKETEEEDNIGDEDDEEENEMKNLREEHRISSVWKTGGDVKSEVLWKLEKLFSSFVTKLEDEERNEVTYETLLNAHKSVTRATKLLTDSDNYTTRDFTLHIAGKKWVQSTLVPLMELGVEDRTFSTLEVKPIKGKETKEEAQARFKRETISKSNAQQQISAFLSFKEAICTEKCSLAITNVLYHLWKTEKEERKEREENRLSGNANEFTKREVATCLSYIRRILQVDAVPSCSSPGEVIMAKSTHNKLVVQLRGALMVVPVICAELADKYNDAWLTDILRIIYFVLRGHDPKDFFKVWKENCLIGEDLNFDKENALPSGVGQDKKKTAGKEKKTQNGSKVQPGGLKSFPVPASLAQRAPSLASKGLLGGILGRERAERAKRADEMSRHSRFGGQYRQALASSSAPADPSSDEQPTQSTSNGAMAKMISRPFSTNQGSTVPQAKAKRSKKNITFAQTDPYVTVALNDSMEEHGQRACVVAATLAERICTGMGLKQLVMRVGVDRVREEGLITVDKEIIYFEVLSSLLKYNRLKLSYEKSQHEEQASSTGLGLYNDFTSEGDVGRARVLTAAGGGGEGEGAGVGATLTGWVPSLQNVINALDNLSFRRVFESLEKLQTTQVKRFADMVSPLGLYKEMICYLRILLESSDETHNEFAIARLYSIFYTSSERKDPLPRILAEWSPGLYSRKHLDTLVELVHETLKTLDTAAAKYGNPAADKKKKKKDKGKKAMDLEQYLAGCLNFDVNEYFKRYIATNPTVRMYTRLLSYHASNDVSVNHYAYCYLQRLCSFRLQQDYPAPPRPPRASTTATDAETAGSELGRGGLKAASWAQRDAAGSIEHEDALTLGHMLFNISTLTTFSDVLAATQHTKPKAMEPLIRLMKSVIRRFGKAAYKNHELLTEALFQHAHVQSFIMEVDSVFEASAYSSSYRADADRAMREKAMDEEGEGEEDEEEGPKRTSTSNPHKHSKDLGPQRPQKSSVPEEEEDEFNEGDYDQEERVTKRSLAAAKKKSAKALKKKKKSKNSDANSDTEEESEDDEPAVRPVAKKRLQKASQAASKSSGSDSDDVQLSDSDNDGDRAAPGSSGRARNLDPQNPTRPPMKNISDDDDDDDENLYDASTRNKEKRSKKTGASNNRAVPTRMTNTSRAKVEVRKAPAKWTAEEDEILKAQFGIFKGSRSVFDVIAMDPDLIAIGNNRNVTAVGRRVRDLNLTAQMDFSDDEGDATAVASAGDTNTAPIDFGTSGSEAEDDGSNASQGNRAKSSLSDRLRDWESDGDENGAASSSTRSASHSASQSSDGATRKRKGESEETLTQLASSPGVSGEQGDSEATQLQSQAAGYPGRGRKLQKKGGRGAEDIDSDNDVFDDNDSMPQETADTVLQQGPGSDKVGTGTGTGGEEQLGGVSKTTNTFRSRSMIVDSDED